MTEPDDPRPVPAVAAERIGLRAAGEIARQLARPLSPGLHLVATPIGNLGDITLRALSVLAVADAIYCEDTRVTRTLLDHYAIATTLRRYHEHNAEAERPRILAALSGGQRVALVSDAGTPLVSDPGYKLVVAATEAGHRVLAVPGPCAALAAVTVSGLPTDSFMFIGFLPNRSGPRYARLRELAAITATLVAYEAPQRLATTIADMAEVFGADRHAVITRELTKLHETCVGGALGDLAARLKPGSDDPITQRGEIAIVVAPAPAQAIDEDQLRDEIAQALVANSVRDAANLISTRLGVSRSRVYALALAMKQTGSSDG